MRSQCILERLLRLVLLVYPPETRTKYGEEIVATIEERLNRVRRSGGTMRAVCLLARECAGLAAAGLERRVSGARRKKIEPAGRRRREMNILDVLFHDLRIAARSLLRQPVFSAIAVAALALGIGASIAIFSVFHAVLLRPLPFGEPERLVAVWESNPERGWHQAQAAAANYLDWREGARSIADMAAYDDWVEERIVLEDGEPEIVLASEVTGNFFSVLGVPPLAGRVFDARHTWAGGEPAVVLSHRFWTRRFGGASSTVGRTLEIEGVRHRVLGVMPGGFAFPFSGLDLWLPVAWDPEDRQQVWFRRAHGLRVVARLAEGASLEQAESELAAIAARLEMEHPETNRRMGVGLTPLRAWIAGDATRPLQILMAAVAFLLLISCANVANLLLARTSGRRSELTIRSALGGTRTRLLFEGLAESGCLAALGGALGLLLGTSAIRPLLAISPDGLPRTEEIGADAAVVLFAIGVTVASGLLFGSIPAWRAASMAPREGTASGSRGASPHRGARRVASILVASEVALTIPLVAGAGLMLRTLSHLSRVEPGFASENVLVARVSVPATRYESEERTARFYRDLFEALAGLPGAESVAMSSRLPFGNQRWSSDFTAEGWPADRYGIEVRHDEVTPGLFRTLGVPLLGGRDFDLSDDFDAPPVVIINQALADSYFPGEDPVGRRVAFDRVPDGDSVWRTIVGVVGNVRRESLALAEAPSFYAPVLQDPTRQVHVLIRGEEDPLPLAAAARERLREIDAALPLFDVTTLDAVVAASVDRERFLLGLLGAAAGIALALAGVGIFGVVFHTTLRRVREIGIRIALGARGRSVVALVVKSGMAPVVAGIAAGVLGAAALAQTMSSLLFGVEPLDLATFAGVVSIVAAAALLACALPARWAARVDPASTLRAD